MQYARKYQKTLTKLVAKSSQLSKTFIVLLLLLNYNTIQAQNLVPNPSFEDIIYCPTDNPFTNNSFFYQIGWNYKNTTQPPEFTDLVGLSFGSPDLMHTCVWSDTLLGSYFGVANHYATAPKNLFGFQYPRTGDAYAHIGYVRWPENNSVLDVRETIFIPLKEKLKKGQGYCVEYYWSRGESSGLALSGPQIMFTDKIIPYGHIVTPGMSPENDFFEPQIVPGEIFSDTSDWNLFSAEYIATGEETHIHIGWFIPFEQMQHQWLDNDPWLPSFPNFPAGFNDIAADIFIDDISVIECDDVAKPEVEIMLPNVFSPDGNGLNDYFFINAELPEGTILSVFNRWGEQVFHSDSYKNDWNGNTKSGQPLTEGTYFVIMKLPSGKVFNNTITLFR